MPPKSSGSLIRDLRTNIWTLGSPKGFQTYGDRGRVLGLEFLDWRLPVRNSFNYRSYSTGSCERNRMIDKLNDKKTKTYCY